MDSTQDQNHRRNQTTPLSIPLQDLSRPPEHDNNEDSLPHRRTLSERGRRLFQSSGSRSSHRPHHNYLSVHFAQDDPFERPDSPHNDLDETESSPLTDRGAFQAALGFSGFAGASFDNHSPLSPLTASALPSTSRGLGTLVGASQSSTSLDDFDYDDGISRQSSHVTDTDTAHLTDTKNVQATPTSPLAIHTRQFGEHRSPSPPRHSRASARLGDDLPDVNGYLSASNAGASRKRSLSPSAAESSIRRAGTVVRKMSQRIVNLSNESEVAELSGRRASARPTESPDPHSTEYTHDGPSSPAPEKDSVRAATTELPDDWVRYANPFKGSSLGVFPPNSKIRTRLCNILVHPFTEPFILAVILFQTVLLAVDSSRSVFAEPDAATWGTSWYNYAFLVIFIIYTLEVAARITVSGFIVNPVEYSTINRSIGIKRALLDKASALFALHHEPTSHKKDGHGSIIASSDHAPPSYVMYGGSRQQARIRLAHRAFLRHSFNRLDFLAVSSYWLSFVLSLFGYQSNQHILIFHMMSSLRILRLLSLTTGTSIILRSLKKAAPLLLNVALLIGFFWLLFAIVGVQSFKASFRRTCVWIDPEHKQPNYTSNQKGNFQFCGGSFGPNGEELPWYFADNSTLGIHKGYLCPVNSLCVSTTNPYNGTVSFDNIFQSLELVFVTMSTNTYSDLMYYLTDSDYLIAALFFALGIVIMTFWLINLLIAVITTSFQVIREESRTSAFANKSAEERDNQADIEEIPKTSLRRLYDKTYWFWIAIIVYGLICQSLRSATMGSERATFISVSETIVTFILLAEIIVRFLVDWRAFVRGKRNWVDLALAVITAIMQIPVIHDSGRPYDWLTVFQILRIYRVVLAVPWTRDLILLVLGNVSGIVNLILFVFLLTFFAAIFACQLFRGEIPQHDSQGTTIHVTFATIYNSFLGMYQVFSSENWTVLLYNVTNYDSIYNTAWIGALFFILWFTLAFFIVLNMFIAVIQENFDVSEDEKRLQQVKAFLQRRELGSSSNATLSLSAMFKLRQLGARRQDPLDYGPAMMDQLLREAVVQDFLDDEAPTGPPQPQRASTFNTFNSRPLSNIVDSRPVGFLRSKISKWIKPSEPNPFYSRLRFSRAYEELDPRLMAREVVTAAEQRRKAQRDYLARHPNYNVSLYIFKPENRFRRICQRMVGPGRGQDRIQGAPPSPVVWYIFSAFLYAAIVAMVLLACISTPLYQKEFFKQHTFSVKNWFVFTDLAFAIIFTIEGAIRIVADGFFWTPNAYLRSSWGFIDGVVLVTLWINVASQLYNEGAVSRAVGAFKALRALRLLNISDSARDTFHSVIVRGGLKVLSAAFVSLSLLVPFAIYGVNLFNGRLESCNDGGSPISDLRNCVLEYTSTPYNWEMVAPRQVSNPWFSFDNFGNSLFILFQIVSQEGWVDVMWSAESITGVFTQPRPYASQGNAMFFVIFNLLGAVFVLTLFVSVFMRNYTEQTGVAFLTAEQRSWLELRKLLRQISPSKRPGSGKQRSKWANWCYKVAVTKTGRWHRFVTAVLLFHLILLCLEFYPQPNAWEETSDWIFFALTIFYIANIGIRIFGLTWARFRRSAWDIYSLIAVTGTFVVTILYRSQPEYGSNGDLSELYTIYQQLHKLFLVSIVLLLIPRNGQLDQLFKTAAASLTAIANLLATWFVLFLVYAIAFTQTFGLTRFNSNETGNINFRNVPKALILLFRMSTGEGWNQIMEDFATVVPPLCNSSSNFLEGDCGSTAWARSLFVSWNILSMYIFVNMFVSLIYESFSYVYQRSSGLAAVSRDETRRFKQAWAEFDPDGTGYIPKEKFPRLLGELSGVFEMRIYPTEFSIGTLKEECTAERRRSELPIDDFQRSDEIDIKKLNERLDQLPIQQIRRRRIEMNIFYEEVLNSADPDRGIPFTSLLMTLAHYKVINDSKSLRLEEFLRRRARLQRVEDDVRRSIVSNFLDTVYWSRRFKEHMDTKRAGRMATIPQLQVPEIFVEDEDSVSPGAPKSATTPRTPRPNLSLQIPTMDNATAYSSSHEPLGSALSSRSRARSNSIQATPSGSIGTSAWARRPANSQLSPYPSDNNASDGQNMFSARPSTARPRSSRSSGEGDASDNEVKRQSYHSGDRLSEGRRSNVTARDVLDVLDNSAWGQSIRRSISVRRNGSLTGSSPRAGTRGEDGGGGGRTPGGAV